MTPPQGKSADAAAAQKTVELERVALSWMKRYDAKPYYDGKVYSLMRLIERREDAARADERVTAHNGAIEKVALMECTWCNNVGPPKRNAATGWWEHETYGICEANKFRNLKLPEVPPVEPSEGERET